MRNARHSSHSCHPGQPGRSGQSGRQGHRAIRIMALAICLTLIASLFAGCDEAKGTTASGASPSGTASASAEPSGTASTGTSTGTSARTTSGDPATTTATAAPPAAREPDYVQKVFGRDIMSIDIIANEADWRRMLDTAIEENYIKVDVVVNGTRFYNVGIRPKGNSSLKEVARQGNDRYSFRLKFDEYVQDQTCFGLDTFVVNNMLADYTYMKEYIAYDLMHAVGVKAPCFGFADISVNGSPRGLYLAVEAYNDSYLERAFGNDKGKLYNVKMVGGAAGQPGGIQQPGGIPPGGILPGGQMPGDPFPGGRTPPGGQVPPAGQMPPGGQVPGRGPLGAATIGGSLQYTDDDPASYKAIFENAVGKSTAADHLRVIAALKILATGTDLERAFDVDAILRYLAAHTMVVNLDSYSGSMAQNYYIHEQNGRITILPWDYNLAWGGFHSGSATAVVNFPIDTPVSGAELSARPLLEKLLANDAYRARYHQYLQQLIDRYFAGDRFSATIQKLNARIADAVRKDPTAFCSFAEYEKAVAAFTTLGNLRAQSVQGQLNGTVPGTTAGQAAQPNLLVSAGSLNLRDMGSMAGEKGENGDKQLPPGKR